MDRGPCTSAMTVLSSARRSSRSRSKGAWHLRARATRARSTQRPGTRSSKRSTRYLQTLTEREREIIKLRYGLADGYTYTIEEVGQILAITHEAVQEIESRAIAKLQAQNQPAENAAGRNAMIGTPCCIPPPATPSPPTLSTKGES